MRRTGIYLRKADYEAWRLGWVTTPEMAEITAKTQIPHDPSQILCWTREIGTTVSGWPDFLDSCQEEVESAIGHITIHLPDRTGEAS